MEFYEFAPPPCFLKTFSQAFQAQAFKSQAFTLAELLIALAILGVIATFAIPKIISAQQASTYNAMAKETIQSISESYQRYRLEGNALDSGLRPAIIIQNYVNYVRTATTGNFDTSPLQASSTTTCEANAPCFFLHNGAVIKPSSCTLGGTSDQHAFMFFIDPDGVYTGNKNSLFVYLYTTGRITTAEHIDVGTLIQGGGCGGTVDPAVGADPDWFRW